ncbi:MAG: chromosome segregation protein ScpA [Actinobacteria bacterium]|nr:MAG: chromosome segregation protein ScpA [Actinomycetota bacterium]
MRAAELDLDLDVFAGPFDLLMAVVLREEVSLSEVSLGEIVVAYLEHLESAGELDLDAATEFLVLIASLLELKSRLLLPAPEDDVPELGPEEAADELLARMLEYRRFRKAAGFLSETLARESGFRYRAAPLPPELRRVSLDLAGASYEPEQLAAAIGGLLRTPPPLDLRHVSRTHVTVEARLAHLRGEDRLTQAVTLFALLEMHKLGEATWTQKKLFGPIEVEVTGDGSRVSGGGRK